MSKLYELASLLEVRGMKKLDKDKFTVKAIVPFVKITEKQCPPTIAQLKTNLLKMESFKPVQTRNSNKIVILDPSKVCEWRDLNTKKLESLGVSENDFENGQFEFKYDNWSYEEIFKAVLPANQENVSSFSKVGHVIHLNLRGHVLEYKKLIGEVLHDKISNCRTVVNKTNVIDNTYRNFAMEVLFGEEDFNVTVKENGLSFQFDFSKVYWNSRLSTEHLRIADLLKTGDILFDVFAGVGPFSIPAVKKKCLVHANDLNPDSFKWLNHNSVLNKVNLTKFKSYNMDGRYFIDEVIKTHLCEMIRSERTDFNGRIHIVMNLPAIAAEFISTLKGIAAHIPKSERRTLVEPIVHVYCFVLGENATSLAKQLIETNIHHNFADDELQVSHVRNVAPTKEMMRVTFTLKESLIFCEKRELALDKNEGRFETAKLEMEDSFLTVQNEAINIIEECFCQYSLDEVFLSFNGGKDCTALLDLTFKVLRDRLQVPNYHELLIVYLQPNYSFLDVENFIVEIKEKYKFNLVIISGGMKEALAEVVQLYPRMKACLLGTRSSDPYSSNLRSFHETDPGWPRLMRVNPILKWSYHDIWNYLLNNNVPYCNLYDRGYTSIGGINNTLPNKSLKYIDKCTGEIKYKPAYLLEDESLERNGRHQPGKKTSVI